MQSIHPTVPPSRRSLLKFAGAAGASSLLARTTFAEPAPPPAAATPMATQGAGFYRMTLGDAEVILISDGGFVFDKPGAYFGSNVGDAAVEKTLAEHFVAPQNLPMHVNTLLVQKAGKTTLIDSGTGGGMGATAGFFFDRLAAIGMSPEKIDTVILTHAHGDHYGGLVDENGKSRFPNAELIVNEIEYDFWTKSPDLSKSGTAEAMRPMFIAGAQKVLSAVPFTRVRVEKEKELRPGITGVLTDGHTPGHLSLLIDGGGTNQLFHNADVFHFVALSLPRPNYYMHFDTDLNRGVEQRKQTLARLAADRMLVSGSHVPFPGFGHVEKTGDKHEWRPIIWQW